MTIVWRLGASNVKQVMTHLPKDRNLAYTAAATVMKVLDRKVTSPKKQGVNRVLGDLPKMVLSI